MPQEYNNISPPPIFFILQVLKTYGLFSHLMPSVNLRSELVTVPVRPHENFMQYNAVVVTVVLTFRSHRSFSKIHYITITLHLHFQCFNI